MFWARSASQLISDVGVYSPAPGEVNIYPLLKNGDIPGQEILDLVLTACDADTVRPMTDLVTVLAPEPVPFSLDVTWYLERKKATSVSGISTAVGRAVQDWLSWQRAELGRDINPSELIRRLVETGAKRVEVNSPAFTPLVFNQVAVCPDSEAVVTFGGIEDG